MHIASQALAIERQASAQTALAERVSRHKTRAILGLMRLNFLSVLYCPAKDMRCGNGSDRTPHPAELFGDDWAEWGESIGPDASANLGSCKH